MRVWPSKAGGYVVLAGSVSTGRVVFFVVSSVGVGWLTLVPQAVRIAKDDIRRMWWMLFIGLIK